MRELELYFTSPWGTARPIIWFNGRPFLSNSQGFKSFFSGLRRCKCRCASSDKSLSKKPAKDRRDPAKILFAGRSPRRWITPHFLASTSTSSCSLGRSVQSTSQIQYGFYISHFSLLEMSKKKKKLLLQVTLVLLLVFYVIGQIIGLPSPSELTGGAPKISEVKVVSLLKCRSFIKIIIVGYFCSVICFWNKPN